MSRRAAAILLGSLGAVALIALGFWWSVREPGERSPAGGEEAGIEAALGDGDRVTLYFPGVGGKLHAEERELVLPSEPESAVGEILRELFSGPQTPGGFGAFAVEVELGSVFVAPEGVAYVDLASGDRLPPPASGSQQEMLSIYSVVNSLVLNIPQIEAVTLLWNGQQRPSFAGHVDTSRPLGARVQLIAG